MSVCVLAKGENKVTNLYTTHQMDACYSSMYEMKMYCTVQRACFEYASIEARRLRSLVHTYLYCTCTIQN